MFTLEKRRLKGVLSMCLNTCCEAIKREPGSSHWQLVAGKDKMVRNQNAGNTIWPQKIYIYVFTVNVLKHWNWLPKEAVESQFFGNFQNLSGHRIGQPALADISWAGGLDWITSRSSLTSTGLWFPQFPDFFPWDKWIRKNYFQKRGITVVKINNNNSCILLPLFIFIRLVQHNIRDDEMFVQSKNSSFMAY